LEERIGQITDYGVRLMYWFSRIAATTPRISTSRLSSIYSSQILDMARDLSADSQFVSKIQQLHLAYPAAFAMAMEWRDRFLVPGTLPDLPEPGSPKVLLKTVALEPCNRGCRQCAVDAQPHLPGMDESAFRLLGQMDKAVEVSVTIGEPFFSPSLKDVVKILLDAGCGVGIVTSGIDFSSSQETDTANFLAALADSDKSRVRLTLSVSDGPHFPRSQSMSHVEAARDAQRRTLEFAIRNNIPFSLMVYLEQVRVFAELIRPTVTTVLGADVPALAAVVGRSSCRTIADVGRQAVLDGRYIPPPALLRACPNQTYGNRFSNRIFVGLTGDGRITPGCCTFVSSFMYVASADACPSKKEVEDKAIEFATTLNRRLGPRSGDVNACLTCLAVAPALRQLPRLERVIGPENFAKVMAMRQTLGEGRRK
jgi:hypothetical protein